MVGFVVRNFPQNVAFFKSSLNQQLLLVFTAEEKAFFVY